MSKKREELKYLDWRIDCLWNTISDLNIGGLKNRVDFLERFLREHTAPDKPSICEAKGEATVEWRAPKEQPEGQWICRTCGNATYHPAPSNKNEIHYRSVDPSCGYCGSSMVDWVSEPPDEASTNPPRQYDEQAEPKILHAKFTCNHCLETVEETEPYVEATSFYHRDCPTVSKVPAPKMGHIEEGGEPTAASQDTKEKT